ncbi:MAG: FixH family protein [Solirubrobacterales bacterium]|nr:FixH family protein [Solirubrobacterales bacterium]
MSSRARLLCALAAVLGALAAPSCAFAHAYLVKTVPSASEVLNKPPATIQLTYDEAVEPRFAIISVTNAAGKQETTGSPSRAPSNPDTLVVPLRAHLPEGWYLIYWRAISVDGHPVQGAFTYAVGPSPGPAPEFKVPSISATATSPNLLTARWVMFVSVMVAIGLFVLRMFIARPVVRRVAGVRLRALSVAFVSCSLLALVAIPVYLDFATANDSLRSVFDVGALVPLYNATAFGRAILDLELCFALFAVAAWISLWLDRPERERRSLAELAAIWGGLLAGAALLIVPGAAGHAAQTSPRGLTLLFDWLHLAAGSVWLGGLVGLLVIWFALPAHRRVAALSVCVPRFSAVALGSVLVLAGSGIGEAVDHLPALDALWLTGYGQAILVKSGLLLLALAIASVNLLRSRPRLLLARQRPEVGEGGARLLRWAVSGEVVVVTGVVFAAAVLSSLAPPPPAFALQNSALAKVGPGTVARTISRAGYQLELLVSPNRAAAPDSFALRVTKNGQPVRGANVTLTFDMTTMQMPEQEYQLAETRPGTYSRSAPALVMVGAWGLNFQIAPQGAPPFNALILDRAGG